MGNIPKCRRLAFLWLVGWFCPPAFSFFLLERVYCYYYDLTFLGGESLDITSWYWDINRPWGKKGTYESRTMLLRHWRNEHSFYHNMRCKKIKKGGLWIYIVLTGYVLSLWQEGEPWRHVWDLKRGGNRRGGVVDTHEKKSGADKIGYVFFFCGWSYRVISIWKTFGSCLSFFAFIIRMYVLYVFVRTFVCDARSLFFSFFMYTDAV